MKPIPGKITLSGEEFTVKVASLDDCRARIKLRTREIEIADDQSLLAQWRCLGHEMIHAWLDAGDLNGRALDQMACDSEVLCSLLGHQLGEAIARGEIP